MLKIGIIGIGDIAQKAYLPVISKRKIEVHLYARDSVKLHTVGTLYRFANLHSSLDSLIASGIHAAFVHTSTSSHYEIVERLLSNNISVYVEKPVTYDYRSTEKLVTLAQERKLLMMVGFNRRFAPAYKKLKLLQDPNMIIMQKNRKALPADMRTFVFDDFIHVVDTLLFLFPHPIVKMSVSHRMQNDLLYHVVVQFISATGAVAIGIMNRDSGVVAESLEVFTAQEKVVVHNVSDTIIYQDRNATRHGVNDWESTLHKRGFEQIVDNFLTLAASTATSFNSEEILHTHRICEEIVQKLNVS